MTPRGIASHIVEVAKLRVLLVEDDVALGRGLQKGVRHLGHDVVWESDPLIARERLLAAHEHFDLGVLDYNMPGLTGVALASQVLAERPGFRFLLLTGSDFIQCVQGLGVSTLVKPVSLHTLNAAMHDLVGAPLRESS